RNRREIAIRAALGASRAQLFGELFLESGMLALAGGVLGFVASRWADGLIRRFILTDLAVVASPLDVRLVALAVGVTTVTALASGLVSDLDLAGAGYTPERAHALIDPVTDRLMAISGVRSMGLSDAGMRPGFITYGYSVPGRDSLPHVAPFSVSAVTPGFFETLGTPIVLGRGFTPADRSARVIIVSASFARRHWPADAPIGKCVKVGGRTSPCLQVVGVCHDRHTAPGDTTTLYEAFVPLGSPGGPAELAKLYPLTSVALRVDRNDGHVA